MRVCDMWYVCLRGLVCVLWVYPLEGMWVVGHMMAGVYVI